MDAKSNYNSLHFVVNYIMISEVSVGFVFCRYQSVVSVYISYLSLFDTVQSCVYNIYKASFSPGSVQQIMP
jgi:hypothetical protein